MSSLLCKPCFYCFYAIPTSFLILVGNIFNASTIHIQADFETVWLLCGIDQLLKSWYVGTVSCPPFWV